MRGVLDSLATQNGIKSGLDKTLQKRWGVLLKHNATIRVLDKSKGFKPQTFSEILCLLKSAERYTQSKLAQANRKKPTTFWHCWACIKPMMQKCDTLQSICVPTSTA